MNDSSPVKKGLLLLGSFIIAFHAAMLSHELCHIAAAYFTGGYVGGISIHPFSWSYAFVSSPKPIVLTAAGALGASLLGLIIYIFSYRCRKAWLIPVMLIGPLIFFTDGGYYLIDTVMKSGGDACELIEYGIGSVYIYGFAVILIIAGIISVTLLIKNTELLTGKFKDRLITLGIGIGSYIVTSLTWHLLFNREEIALWLTYAAFESVIVLSVAAIPFKFQSKKIKPAGWKSIITIDLIGIFIIVFLLMLSDRATISERPEDYPEVLMPPEYATEKSYLHTPTLNIYFLKYEIPQTIEAAQLNKFLKDMHSQHGYTYLKHDLSDPNILNNENWLERSYELEGELHRYRSYRLTWLKFHSDFSVSKVLLMSEWEKDSDISPYAIHTIKNNITSNFSKRVLEYQLMHPDEFDPNHIEAWKNRLLSPKTAIK